MKKIITIIILLAGAALLHADDVTVSGVDSRFLAVSGEVNIYAVVTGADGRMKADLNAGDFRLLDAPAGMPFGDGEQEISGFSAAGERRDGISFLLLMDDSASMYRNAAGDRTDNTGEMRAAMARSEAKRFLRDIGSSLDRAGLAEFGTGYRVLAGPRTDRASVNSALAVHEEPVTEEAYTELYAAIAESAGTMSSQKGRRIVILFSDGVNFAFAEKRGEPHPEYGMRSWNPDDALIALREEAVTLYAVRFGPDRDEALASVARATGGLVFDVDGESELEGLYGRIRERILSEYRLSYRPRPTGAMETRVGLELASGSSRGELTYLSGFMMGRPAGIGSVLLSLLAVPAAALILWVLYRLKAAEMPEQASLGRLRPRPGETMTVALSGGKTVIAPSPGGSGTVIASPEELKAPASGATIVVEKGKDGKWRASGEEGVTVNNRKTDSTVLEDGDVIRAGEELIVFDDGNG